MPDKPNKKSTLLGLTATSLTSKHRRLNVIARAWGKYTAFERVTAASQCRFETDHLEGDEHE